MIKVVGYPCSKCKTLTEGKILIRQFVSEQLTIIRFKKECKCNQEEVHYFTPYDLKHYLKDVKEE